MPQRVFLDSDLLSDILKGQNPQIKIHKDIYAARFLRLEFTSASLLEILYGLYRVNPRAQIRRAEALFAGNRETLPLKDDYRLTAEISGSLDRQGTPIGRIDPLIVACAIRRGYGVASANTSHYQYIQQAGYNFHPENWRQIKSLRT